jgi:hypothetical protein
LDGGADTDVADYSDKTTSVAVTLNGASYTTVSVGGVAEDTIREIENVTGGSGADRLTGDGSDNVFRGGGGADVLDGGAGVDTADYSDKTASVAVTLNGGTNASVTVGGADDPQHREPDRRLGRRCADRRQSGECVERRRRKRRPEGLRRRRYSGWRGRDRRRLF